MITTRASWALLAAAMVVCLFGCRRELPPDQRQVLTVAFHLGGSEGRDKHWQAWKTRFEADNPSWRLEKVDVTPGAARGTYVACANADNLPDVVQLFDLEAWLVEEQYIQPLPQGHSGSAITPVYGAGGGVRLCGIAVNATIASAAGIKEPPQTWTQFVGCLRRIQQHLAESGLGARGTRALMWGSDWSARLAMEMALCVDAEIDTTPGTLPATGSAAGASPLTGEAAESVVGHLAELVREFVAETRPAALTYDQQRDLFFDGKAAVWFTGTWIGPDIAAAGGGMEVDFWPMPSMTGQTARFIATVPDSGWGLSATIAGERLAAARRAVDALLSPEVYRAYLDAEGCLGTARSAGPRVPSVPGKAALFYANAVRRLDAFGAIGSLQARKRPAPRGFESAMEKASQGLLEDALAHRVTKIPLVLERLEAAWQAGLAPPVEGP